MAPAEPDGARPPMDTRAAAAERAHFLNLFPAIVAPMFIAVMDQTIVATALPALSTAFGDATRVTWVVVAYLVANTIAAPVYGRMGDAYGRARVMVAALAVMIGGSIACALAPTMDALIAARFVQGLGGGGLMTLSQALIGETIPPRARGRYQGYLAAVVVSSNALGPVLGGALTAAFGWRSIFWVNLPAGLLALALARRLPRTPPERAMTRFDSGGLVLFILFIAPALVALEQARKLDPVLAPLAAVRLASIVHGQAADGGKDIGEPRFLAAHEFPCGFLARQADQGILKDVLRILRGTGLLACEQEKLGYMAAQPFIPTQQMVGILIHFLFPGLCGHIHFLVLRSFYHHSGMPSFFCLNIVRKNHPALPGEGRKPYSAA